MQPDTKRDATAAQRKSAERDRKRRAGLTRLPDIWAHPDDHATIKAFAAQLASKRAQ